MNKPGSPFYTISIGYYPEGDIYQQYLVYKDDDIQPIAVFYDSERAQQYIDYLRRQSSGNPT